MLITTISTIATLISSVIVEDLRLFNNLIRRLEQAGCKHHEDVPTGLWTEELGRLRVWAANVGAHQIGQSSLDFRLRDASRISEEVVKLLHDLSGVLKETLEYMDEDDQGDIPSEDLPPPDSDGNPMTGLQYLFDEVVTIIKCLYQMAMLIRNPAQHDFILKSEKSEMAAFEEYDKKHAREKFPQAEAALTDGLGAANTRRRRYLKYRERHNAKLGKGLGDVQGLPETESKILSETVASEFKIPDNDRIEVLSDADFSQTSYAPSLLDAGTIVIPQPPKESAGGKPFVCPYCFCIITVDNQKAWTRHIFQDLRPYSCISRDCSTRETAYASRHQWFSHLTSSHGIDNLRCALCAEGLRTQKQSERHVARHLEEFALFVLPRPDHDEDDSAGNKSQTTDSTILRGRWEESKKILLEAASTFKEHERSLEILNSTDWPFMRENRELSELLKSLHESRTGKLDALRNQMSQVQSDESHMRKIFESWESWDKQIKVLMESEKATSEQKSKEDASPERE